MAYSEPVLIRAKEILKSREKRAESELLKRQEEAFEKCPELLDIKNEMAQSGLSVIKLMLEGGDVANRLSEIEKENKALQKRRAELLVRHGFPEDYLSIKYFCETCSDTGYVGTTICTCHKELLSELSYEELSKVSNVKDCRFDNFELGYYSDSETADGGTGESIRQKKAIFLV